MIVPRKTLLSPVVFEGVGLHSGVPVKMTVHPSDGGIVFRIDAERVLAIPANVTDTTRSTKLGSIGTIEHLMSAFCGLEITDAEVELDAPELPGMDGSSSPFVSALTESGFEKLEAKETKDLFRRVFYQNEQVNISMSKGTGDWRYEFITAPRWPGEQIARREDVIVDYAAEIAPSRTIAFLEEIPAVVQMGLGKGLDERSVLVLGTEGYKNEARFDNEPARHKLLDLMGDLYLTGVPARQMNVVAERSGHRANVAAAAMLVEALA